LGYGTREHDYPPYRLIGPATIPEYEVHTERYDGQIKELLDLDPSTMSVEEKISAVRKYREEQYEKLVDAVYKRRGWSGNGIPTLETTQRLGIDFPEIVKLIAENG
jgi:aldehyde:ferredoxin oxidoreductase